MKELTRIQKELRKEFQAETNYYKKKNNNNKKNKNDEKTHSR